MTINYVRRMAGQFIDDLSSNKSNRLTMGAAELAKSILDLFIRYLEEKDNGTNT